MVNPMSQRSALESAPNDPVRAHLRKSNHLTDFDSQYGMAAAGAAASAFVPRTSSPEGQSQLDARGVGSSGNFIEANGSRNGLVQRQGNERDVENAWIRSLGTDQEIAKGLGALLARLSPEGPQDTDQDQIQGTTEAAMVGVKIVQQQLGDNSKAFVELSGRVKGGDASSTAPQNSQGMQNISSVMNDPRNASHLSMLPGQQLQAIGLEEGQDNVFVDGLETKLGPGADFPGVQANAHISGARLNPGFKEVPNLGQHSAMQLPTMNRTMNNSLSGVDYLNMLKGMQDGGMAVGQGPNISQSTVSNVKSKDSLLADSLTGKGIVDGMSESEVLTDSHGNKYLVAKVNSKENAHEASLYSGYTGDAGYPGGIQAGALATGDSSGANSKVGSAITDVAAFVVPGGKSHERITTDGLMQISSGLHGISTQGGGEMRVRLMPDELGELHLRVITNGNGVGLQIHASSEKAKKIIEESLSFLKESLSAQHLSLNHVDVSLTGQSSAQSNNSHSNSQGAADQGGQSNSWFSGDSAGFQRSLNGGNGENDGSEGNGRNGRSTRLQAASNALAPLGRSRISGWNGENGRLDVVG